MEEAKSSPKSKIRQRKCFFFSYQKKYFMNLLQFWKIRILFHHLFSHVKRVQKVLHLLWNIGNRQRAYTLTPLDEVSHHLAKRTDALLSQLREEFEKQMITTTQLLGYLLHRY